MNDYQAENLKNLEALEKLAREIVYHLGNCTLTGKPWTLQPRAADDEIGAYSTPVLVGGEAKIYINREQGKKDRLSIYGSMHIGKNGSYVQPDRNRTNPSITVAISRGAQVIAREITRRVLPEYLSLLALAQEQRTRQTEYENKRKSNLRILAEFMNTFTNNPRGLDKITDETSTTGYFSDARGYGDAIVSGDDVELKLHNLSMAQALAILAIVKAGK